MTKKELILKNRILSKKVEHYENKELLRRIKEGKPLPPIKTITCPFCGEQFCDEELKWKR